MNHQWHLCVSLLFCLAIPLPAWAQKPELAIQKGHLGKINRVIFSPDEKFIATSGGSNGPPTFILWDAEFGTFLRSLNLSSRKAENRGKFYRLDRFSEDGRQVIGVDDQNFIALNTYSGKVVREGKKSELPQQAIENTYRKWQRGSSNFVIKRKGEDSDFFVSDKLQNKMASSAFLPNYQYIVATYERLKGGAEGGANALPVIGGTDLPIKMWDIAAKKEVPIPIRIDPGTISNAIISGDGHYILIDDIKGKTQVWKTADWKLLAEFQKPKGVSFFSSRVQEPGFITISPKGTYVVHSRQVKTINEDFERHEVILTNLITGEHRYLPPQNSVMLLGIKTDAQKRVAAFADMSGVIYTWSLEEGKFKNLFSEGKTSDFYVNAGFNRSGTKLMTASIHYKADEQGFIIRDDIKTALRVWDMEAGRPSHLFFADFLPPSEKEPFIYAGKEDNEFLLVTSEKMYKLNLGREELRPGNSPISLSPQNVEKVELPCKEGLVHYLAVPNSNMALLFPQRRWLGFDSNFLLFDEQRGNCVKIKTGYRIAAVDVSADASISSRRDRRKCGTGWSR